VKENKIIGDFEKFIENIEILIINIPPSAKDKSPELFPAKIAQILDVLPNMCKVIFVSSTSVYGDTNSRINEDANTSPTRDGGKILLETEQLLITHLQERLTIVRFAGLFGPDRHPGRFLSKMKAIPNPKGVINLIHQDDCIQLLSRIITTSSWGELYNGCSDEHPQRDIFYTKAAEVLNVDTPTFSQDEPTSYKIVDNSKSKDILGMKYAFPDPLKSLASL
jgi:nucleoside-diphosphate-sugar epimerase